jgi:hypothetical protein
MTPKVLLSEKFSLSSVNKPPIHSTSIVDYSNLLNLETYLDAIGQEEHLNPTDDVDFRKLFHSERHRGLDHVLRKLSAMKLPGKEHVEEYIRDQHRRHCRPNTLRQSLITLDNFLTFIGTAGKEGFNG